MSSDGNDGCDGVTYEIDGGAYESTTSFERIEPTRTTSVLFTPTPAGTTNWISSCETTVKRLAASSVTEKLRIPFAPPVAVSPSPYSMPLKISAWLSTPKLWPMIATVVPPAVCSPSRSGVWRVTAPCYVLTVRDPVTRLQSAFAEAHTITQQHLVIHLGRDFVGKLPVLIIVVSLNVYNPFCFPVLT